MNLETLARHAAARLTLEPFDFDTGNRGLLATIALVRAAKNFDESEWVDLASERLGECTIDECSNSARACRIARASIELLQVGNDPALAEIAAKVSDYLVTSAHRTEDGLLLPSSADCIPTESLFLSAPLLAIAGARFGDRRFTNEAALQLYEFSGHAHDAVSQLFWRAWHPREHRCDEVLEGRANAYAFTALVDSLEHLPVDHHRRRAIQMILTYTASALEAHQDDEGCWHDLMDDDSSAVEVSATALIVTALARGIKLGLVQDYHRDCALRGWQAVQAKLDDADAACALLAASAIASL